jgi:hypothetical protein
MQINWIYLQNMLKGLVLDKNQPERFCFFLILFDIPHANQCYRLSKRNPGSVYIPVPDLPQEDYQRPVLQTVNFVKK